MYVMLETSAKCIAMPVVGYDVNGVGNCQHSILALPAESETSAVAVR